MLDTVIDNVKVIVYDPNTLDNIPRFFNEKMNEVDNDLILFVFEDLWNAAKSQEELVKTYKSFLTKYDLPYALYPYYADFNKIRLDGYKKNFPKAELICVSNNEKLNILTSIGCSLLLINKTKLAFNNIKFNEQYPLFFYLFDLLINTALCGMTSSFNFYQDVYNSWEMFNKFESTYKMNISKIGEEKAKYFEEVVKNIKNDNTIHDINQYINILKSKQEMI